MPNTIGERNLALPRDWPDNALLIDNGSGVFTSHDRYCAAIAENDEATIILSYEVGTYQGARDVQHSYIGDFDVDADDLPAGTVTIADEEAKFEVHGCLNYLPGSSTSTAPGPVMGRSAHILAQSTRNVSRPE